MLLGDLNTHVGGEVVEDMLGRPMACLGEMKMENDRTMCRERIVR